jgi:phage gpG-like protein
MPAIEIKVSGDRQVLQVLGEILDKAEDLRPVLEFIGMRMVESTKRRFDTLVGPDGERWAPNADSTMERYLNRLSGSYKKDGTLSAKGQRRKASKKPLTGETGALRTTIHSAVVGKDTVRISSTLPYARVQQEGAKQGQFGRGSFATRKGTFPIPWGDIPARPFLGFSDQDQADIIDILRSHFKPA